MIDCKKIAKETKDLMFSLIEKSDEESREYALFLCEDRDGNIIHSNFCAGLAHTVPTEELSKLNCPLNTKKIAGFHTHARHEAMFGMPQVSPNDVIGPAIEGLNFCHGWSYDEMKYIEEKDEFVEIKGKNVVNCYKITDKRLLELGNRANKARKENDKKIWNDTISDMRSRIEDLEKHKKDTARTICSMSMDRK